MTINLNSRNITIAVSIIIIGSMVYFLGPILVPFIIGLFLAYLANPVVNKMMQNGFSRNTASLIMVLFIIVFSSVFLLITIPIIKTQIATLISMMPEIISTSINKLNQLSHYIHLDSEINPQSIGDSIKSRLSQQPDIAAWMLATTIYSGKAVINIVIDLVLIPFVTFYLLRDWSRIKRYIQKQIPTNKKSKVRIITNECEAAFGAFLRGQLLVIVFMCVFYTITFTLAGLNVGIILGIFMGFMSLIPYIGSVIGFIVVAVAALAQTGDLVPLVWVVLSYCIGHILENFYLSPKFIGQNIGLHPVLVIFVILAGGTLFGIWGVILALPFSAIANILLTHIYPSVMPQENVAAE